MIAFLHILKNKKGFHMKYLIYVVGLLSLLPIHAMEEQPPRPTAGLQQMSLKKSIQAYKDALKASGSYQKRETAIHYKIRNAGTSRESWSTDSDSDSEEQKRAKVTPLKDKFNAK
jgi:hypothetical protein